VPSTSASCDDRRSATARLHNLGIDHRSGKAMLEQTQAVRWLHPAAADLAATFTVVASRSIGPLGSQQRRAA
jgi:hypothetical protein